MSEPTTVSRYDRGTFKPVKMDNGWLRVDSTLTRTGVLCYANPDGTIRRELRHPTDVEHADSLHTLALVPLTLRHPPEKLTAENTKKFQVGTVGQDVRVENGHIRATLMVTDAEAISAVETGRARELSCGYSCSLDCTPGEWNGQRYDAKQLNIRYNHVALEPMGRAGHDVRVHMDSLAEVPAVQTPTEESSMLKSVRIDGVDYEVSPEAAQAFAKVQTAHEDAAKASATAHEDAMKTAKGNAEKLQGRLDAIEAELKTTKASLAKATDPQTVRAAVQARVALEQTATKHLGNEIKLDGMDDQTIMTAVIQKTDAEFKADGKSPEYILGRFEQATRAARNDKLDALRAAAVGSQNQPGSGEVDSKAARAAFMKRSQDAWKTTTNTDKGN